MKWIISLGLIACVSQPVKTSQLEECWEERKTVNILENLGGVIVKDADWEYISVPESAKLFPCNLPPDLQNGDSVLFSAEQKEIMPNERWAGYPIRLTQITMKNSDN